MNIGIPIDQIAPKSGDRVISQAFFDELVKRLAQLGSINADGLDFSFEGGSTNFVAPSLPDVFVAKLGAEGTSGNVGKYAWTRQQISSDPSGYEDVADGMSGTATADPARALDGAQGLAEDSLVIMFPGWHSLNGGEVERGWRFLYCANALPCVQLVTHVSCDDDTLNVETGWFRVVECEEP
jgi:hypothetical protein